VVTGLGLVTPVGNDVDSTWQALLAGRSGAAPITKFDASNQQVRFACEVKGFDPLQYIDRKEAKRYDLFAQLALAAAHQAITQAGLEGHFPAAERTGTRTPRRHPRPARRTVSTDCRTRRNAERREPAGRVGCDHRGRV